MSSIPFVRVTYIAFSKPYRSVILSSLHHTLSAIDYDLLNEEQRIMWVHCVYVQSFRLYIKLFLFIQLIVLIKTKNSTNETKQVLREL